MRRQFLQTDLMRMLQSEDRKQQLQALRVIEETVDRGAPISQDLANLLWSLDGQRHTQRLKFERAGISQTQEQVFLFERTRSVRSKVFKDPTLANHAPADDELDDLLVKACQRMLP